jgi:hypothetical protein
MPNDDPNPPSRVVLTGRATGTVTKPQETPPQNPVTPVDNTEQQED